MLKKIFGLILAMTLFAGSSPANAIAPAGTNCPKIGQTKVVSSYKFTCVKKGTKRVWNAGVRVLQAFKDAPQPQIQGDARVGETLSISTTGWPSGTNLTIEWFADGLTIPGEDSADLYVTEDELGKVISAKIRATKAGFASLTQSFSTRKNVVEGDTESDRDPIAAPSPSPTSTQTAAPLPITSKSPAPSVPSVPAIIQLTPIPLLSGELAVGKTVSVVTGTWDSGVSFKFKWMSNGIEIPNQTSSSYLIQSSDLGNAISCAVEGSKRGMPSVTRTSAQSKLVTEAELVSTPVPLISGTASVGSSLSANSGTWDTNTVLNYQWLRAGVPISGATNSSYLVTQTDVGSALSLAVTGSKPGFTSVTRTSTQSKLVAEAKLVSTPVPLISGTASVGSSLSANSGTWDSNTLLAYQWLKSGSPIAGATGSSYLVTQTDVGSVISLAVTGSKAGFTSVTKTSLATLPVIQPSLTLTTVPVISGSATLDSTLNASWQPWDSGVAISIQWMRNGVAISGATSATYKVVATDVGASLSLQIVGNKAGYLPVTKTSQASAPVTATTFTRSQTPTISGVTMVTKTLTATAGAWDPAASLSFAWLRNGQVIPGSTALTYTLTSADRLALISFRITGSKTGALPISLTSAPTAAISELGFSSLGSPTLSGSYSVGSVVGVSPGTWDSGTTFDYQWRKTGVNIAGATSNTYLIPANAVGSSLSVVVTAKLGSAVSTKTVSATSVVVAGTLQAGSPSFGGELKVGGQLYRSDGTWTPGTQFAYQWLSNGIAISGATSYLYTVKVESLGTVVSLRVTGSLAGYTPVTVTTSGQGPIGLGTIGTFLTPAIVGGVADFNTGQISTKVGQTLSLSRVAYCGTNLSTAVTVRSQWTRNGVAIPGATGATYSVVQADSGTQIALLSTCESAGYSARSQSSASVPVLLAPTLPTIVSIDQSQVTQLKIFFSGVPNNTNTFSLVFNSSNRDPSSCDATSCTFSNLAANTTYVINYTARAAGGSISSSTSGKTYQRLNLNAAINSLTKQGDKWTLSYVPVSGLTYNFVWELYGLGTSQCTNGQSGATTQSTITVFASIANGCQKALRIWDTHGNMSDVLLSNYTSIATTPTVVSGSLSASNAAPDSTIGYSFSTSGFYQFKSRTTTLLNSSGSIVVMAISPTASRVSGDLYSGNFEGTIYLNGVVPGTYSVRVTVTDSTGAVTTLTLGSLQVG